jgi:hypothetical protein
MSLKNNPILLLSFIPILIGVLKFDIFIYPTLDYFGKFVMVGVLNIFPFFIATMLYGKFQNSKFKYLAIVWGIIVMLFFWQLSTFKML